MLADAGTKSYIVGSTNPLLLQQKDKYSDILINLDEITVNITSTSLRTALSLSPADRRWIDFLTQTVQDTWDPLNPNRPHTMGYAGSEEFIRQQFEEYLLALLSSVSYHDHQSSSRKAGHFQAPLDHASEEDPSLDFNSDFIHAWKQTSNCALFTRLTAGSSLFDIIEPKHPTAGGLSVEDVQRRLAQQVAELHLDERVREGRETLEKHLAIGKERFGQFSSKLWTDIEALREAQRQRSSDRNTRSSEDGGAASHVKHNDGASTEEIGHEVSGSKRYAWPTRAQAPDLTQIQATAKDASVKASAYLSSWGTWARDRGKEWQEKRSVPSTAQTSPRIPAHLSTSGPQAERTSSTLSPTGSDRSGIGRLSSESATEKTGRWNSILRKGKERSGEIAGSEGQSKPPTGSAETRHAADSESTSSVSEATTATSTISDVAGHGDKNMP